MKLFLLVYFSFFQASFATESLGHSLDFKESLSILLERSPRFDSAKKSFEIQNLNAMNAKRSWLPTLDLKFEHGFQGENSEEDKYSNFANALTLKTVGNLYNNGVDLIKVDSAELRKHIEEIQLKLEK